MYLPLVTADPLLRSANRAVLADGLPESCSETSLGGTTAGGGGGGGAPAPPGGGGGGAPPEADNTGP